MFDGPTRERGSGRTVVVVVDDGGPLSCAGVFDIQAMSYGPELTPKQHKDLQWLKRKEDKPRYFVNGWLAVTMCLLLIAAIAGLWYWA